MPGPRPRLRNLVGVAALVGGLAVYALLVMRLALAIGDMALVVETLFYGAAGLVWIWPAKWLITRMQANDRQNDAQEGNKDRNENQNTPS